MTASPLLPSAPRGRARWLVTAFLVVLLGLQVGAAPLAAAAEPTTYQGHDLSHRRSGGDGRQAAEQALVRRHASTWMLSKAQPAVVQVLAYRGVSASSPVAASAGGISSTATVISPADAAVTGSRVVTLAGIARTATLPAGNALTERSEITTTSTAPTS